jgi:hypothetical protein
MKKFLTSKKGIALLATMIAAIAAAVGAYAYFTNSGSGTGTASVGTSSHIDLSSDPVSTLYPGGADVPVTVDISNPGSGAQYVGTISGSVDTYDPTPLSNSADDCLGSWFEVDDITYNNTLAAGGSDSADTNVRMLDSGTNQDACKNATVTIEWSSN